MRRERDREKREKARGSAGEEEYRECMRKLCPSAGEEEEEEEEGVWRKREEVIYIDF